MAPLFFRSTLELPTYPTTAAGHGVQVVHLARHLVFVLYTKKASQSVIVLLEVRYVFIIYSVFGLIVLRKVRSVVVFVNKWLVNQLFLHIPIFQQKYSSNVSLSSFNCTKTTTKIECVLFLHTLQEDQHECKICGVLRCDKWNPTSALHVYVKYL